MSKYAAIVLLTLGCANVSNAQLADLREVRLDYRNYADSTRDPLFYKSTPKESIDVVLRIDLAKYFFFDNLVHSMTNSSQYYMVGWNFKLGAQIFDGLSIQYEHYSKHLLDDRYPYMKFPVEDSIGFSWTIFSAKTNRKGAF